MRTRPFLLLAVALAVVAATGPSAAGADANRSNRIVAAAYGAYSLNGTAAGSVITVKPFLWYVVLRANGTATGHYTYTQVRDGVELSVSGSLSCAFFEGDRVWVGGTIADSSRPTLIGLDMWFQAQDNGFPGAGRDISSTIGAGPPGTGQQYCDDHPPVLFPFVVERGDLLVAG